MVQSRLGFIGKNIDVQLLHIKWQMNIYLKCIDDVTQVWDIFNRIIAVKITSIDMWLSKLRSPELFAYVIFMVFRVYIYVKKTIPHRDCSETGAISKYVSNMAFLYEIYWENATFRSEFRFYKKRTRNIVKKNW